MPRLLNYVKYFWFSDESTQERWVEPIQILSQINEISPTIQLLL